MKLFILFVFILPVFTAFSQFRHTTTNLPDSLARIDLSENLYREINLLKSANDDEEKSTNMKRQAYEDMKEFCVRQNVYRNFFDRLEMSGKPSPDSLSYYYSVVYGLLMAIPDTGNGFPVTVYYQPADTAEISEWKPAFGKLPLNDFALRFIAQDSLLLARYPKAYSLFKQGKIVFSSDHIGAPVISPLQVPKYSFPALYLTDNTADAKRALADKLLVYILHQGPDLLSFLKRQGQDVDGDLIEEYTKLEQTKYAKATLDEKISIRRKFIEYLKTLYKKYE